MKPALLAMTIVAVLSLGACKKSDDAAAVDAPAEIAQDAGDNAPTTKNEPADDGAEASDNNADSDAAKARKEQQDKLDYATMEDGYLNDAKGQWAASATASSSNGSANDASPDEHVSYSPWQATGAPNGDDWLNNSQDVGFDWIQLKYANAITPTEVRAVLGDREAPESITKVEFIDTTGKSHTVWSGLNDTKRDERGQRTWFVRKIDKADYMTDTVKLTFANNVSSGYKHVDAVQLIGQ